MRRRVSVQPTAVEDLNRIAHSIRIRVSAESSRRWLTMLRQAIRQLSTTAAQHPEAEDESLQAANVKMAIVGKYRHYYLILFTFDDQFVYVYHVRHAAQDALTEDDF